MDTKPPKIPTPDKVFSPDPEPAGVEFLGAELPEHVRAFFDEQRKSCEPKYRRTGTSERVIPR